MVRAVGAMQANCHKYSMYYSSLGTVDEAVSAYSYRVIGAGWKWRWAGHKESPVSAFRAWCFWLALGM